MSFGGLYHEFRTFGETLISYKNQQETRFASIAANFATLDDSLADRLQTVDITACYVPFLSIESCPFD